MEACWPSCSACAEPAGLAGRKIRCLPLTVVTELVRLMGAAATRVAFDDIYTGLQARAIDNWMWDAKVHRLKAWRSLLRPRYLPPRCLEITHTSTADIEHSSFDAKLAVRTSTVCPPVSRKVTW